MDMQGGSHKAANIVRGPVRSRSRTPRTLIPDEALSRITESVLVPGNDIKLLRDAAENYPAWLDAIASAERYIHFESYIIHDDEPATSLSNVRAYPRFNLCDRCPWLVPEFHRYTCIPQSIRERFIDLILRVGQSIQV